MTSQSIRALTCAVIVLCVLGGWGLAVDDVATSPGTASPIGEAAAQSSGFETAAPRGRWDPTTGSGEIVLDNGSYYTVFQGERDIATWYDTTGRDVTDTVLEGVAGRSEGEPFRLSNAIPADQPAGRYAGDDLTVRVQQPRIRTVTLYNSVGSELEDPSELQRDESLLVVVDWNYAAAEDLQVDLIDHDGDLSIEREVLSTDPTQAQSDRLPDDVDADTLAREEQGIGATNASTAYWLFDLGAVDDGTYTLRVEGVDDLTTGDAVETIRFTVGTDDTSTPAASPTPTTSPPPTASPTATPAASPTETSSPHPTTAPGTSERPPTTQPPTATDTVTGPTTQPTTTEEPGFGVTAALAALVVMLLKALRVNRR
ncbi:hypothetical protein [Halopenitus persicus]|uniref:hypothetical protein n=1 Tax=Halopenitus persicus TaxID=1048396 RepID=UPI000BBB64CE|nr:hypothetical protein [Halopenitus persicus]